MRILRLLWLPCRWLAQGVATLALWTFWLALVVLIGIQVYVASVNELEVPGFVLRDFERRLEASGMHATVGRTRFDPAGRVLLEDLRITLPVYQDPLVTADAAYARVDLWALAFGRFEPLELRLTGASVRVPAMFSASGSNDEVIRDLDAVVLPHGSEIEISNLNFRLGDLPVSIHGTLHVGGLQAGRKARLPFTDLLVSNYGPITRQFADLVAQLGALDRPILQAELAPSESHGAIVRATLFAQGLRLPAPLGIEATDLRLSSRFPLPIGGPEDIEVAAEAGKVRWANADGTADGLRALVRGRLTDGLSHPVWEGAEFAASRAGAAGFDVRSLLASLQAGPWPRLHVEARGRLLGAPLATAADLDFAARTADVRFEGALAPGLLGPVGRRLRRDLGRFLQVPTPIETAGEARFGAGWKFQGVDGRAEARGLLIHGVRLDDARARIEFDGHRLFAPEAFVRFGGNFARGSYEQNISDRRYRFLLEGRLQPLVISPWFNTQWWSEFFGHFQFPAAPPAANMDWRGRWPTDHESAIFLVVDSAAAAYNGAAFDHAFARLFVRPNVITDGLDFQADRGPGHVGGTFRLAVLERHLDLDLASSLDFGSAIQGLGPKGAPLAALFAFDQAPTVTLRGRWDLPAKPAPGPAPATAPAARIRALHLEANSNGSLRFHDFPLDRAVLTAEMRDETMVLDPLTIGFAGGVATGRAEVSGRGSGERLAFNLSLANASLSRAIATVQKFSARGRKAAKPVPDQFLKGKDDARLDLTLAANGSYLDPLSYRGGGTAAIQGSGLAEVRMLGLLSDLFPFTTLRFNSAQATFTAAGPRLLFSEVRMNGANSLIAGSGSYDLARHGLDFRAKISPLGNSKGFVQQLIDVPLSFVSKVFEVRLAGTIDKPEWSFANSPIGLLNGSAGAGTTGPAAPAAPAAPPPAGAGIPAGRGSARSTSAGGS
jgi:hypothetical protein